MIVTSSSNGDRELGWASAWASRRPSTSSSGPTTGTMLSSQFRPTSPLHIGQMYAAISEFADE